MLKFVTDLIGKAGAKIE
ncbi:Protein of unknown function [Propionibacterium freudenreichii]|nr:Protein of unknown function [Propionibacterium freudenreichii]